MQVQTFQQPFRQPSKQASQPTKEEMNKIFTLSNMHLPTCFEWVIKSWIQAAMSASTRYSPIVVFAYLGLIRRHLENEHLETDMTDDEKENYLKEVKRIQSCIIDEMKCKA